ncbi:MAG: hypothetical protein QOH17_2152 [Pseudonocardiales bacterium]|nr:hypothetical protein [Pseudonocardiales bacterium]
MQTRIKTPIRHTTEVIIAGWSPSTVKADVLGSLLLAAYDPDGELVYLGDVGTGFTDATRRHLVELRRPAVLSRLAQAWRSERSLAGGRRGRRSGLPPGVG